MRLHVRRLCLAMAMVSPLSHRPVRGCTAFACTDPSAALADILGAGADRFALAQCFENLIGGQRTGMACPQMTQIMARSGTRPVEACYKINNNNCVEKVCGWLHVPGPP